jgi:hypothetical protein
VAAKAPLDEPRDEPRDEQASLAPSVITLSGCLMQVRSVAIVSESCQEKSA